MKACEQKAEELALQCHFKSRLQHGLAGICRTRGGERETFEGFGVQVGITPQALVTKRAGQRVMGRNSLSGWVAV